MGFVWGIITVLLAIVWVITISDIIRRHLGRGRTAAWLLIVVILPFAGALLYWALRKPTPEEAQRQIDLEADIRRGGSRPPSVRR